MSKNVAEIVTKQIIKGLERGQIAWKKPWASVRPHNFITGHEYQGVNVLLAALACEEFSYKFPLFASFKQIQSKGWKLVKGAKGNMITFTKRYEREVEDEETGKTELKKASVLRYYYVFNIQDVDGVNLDEYVKEFEIVKHAEAESILALRNPVVKYGGNRAYYSPHDDYIQLPNQGDFKEQLEFYLTAFHELTHWSGNEHRFDRLTPDFFGGHEYSKEELVAETGANILAMNCGIVQEVKDNSIAYMQSWIKALENNPKWIIHAAAQATRACAWLMGDTEELQKPGETKPAPDWNELIHKWEEDMAARHGEHWSQLPECEAVILADGNEIANLDGNTYDFKAGTIKKAMANVKGGK